MATCTRTGLRTTAPKARLSQLEDFRESGRRSGFIRDLDLLLALSDADLDAAVRRLCDYRASGSTNRSWPVLLCAVAAGLGNFLGGLIIGRSATYAALIGLGAAVTVVLILAMARVVRGAVQGSKVDR